MSMTDILIVEDDSVIAQGLAYALEGEGWQTALAATGTVARQMISERIFDLILLDVTLPDDTGYELCKLIKSKSDTPIIS